mmetsp:Transcript_9191/g.22078  ORF Transcript_9191/g.22078 Transcript_9191/m.22078 type:complete len:208 (-) Transcript_9191:355-978(-)
MCGATRFSISSWNSTNMKLGSTSFISRIDAAISVSPNRSSTPVSDMRCKIGMSANLAPNRSHAESPCSDTTTAVSPLFGASPSKALPVRASYSSLASWNFISSSFCLSTISCEALLAACSFFHLSAAESFESPALPSDPNVPWALSIAVLNTPETLVFTEPVNSEDFSLAWEKNWVAAFIASLGSSFGFAASSSSCLAFLSSCALRN